MGVMGLTVIAVVVFVAFVLVLCGAAKLGGPEDTRPLRVPDPLLSKPLYPREWWKD